ncbi:class I SAM-dependent methyltransferase [Nisaea sp.]|uniref:class I SAM-dependent methyltransferase n=1 Tax=Nisaea sp. TaxID=2024842 RepID=UPI003B519DCD
MKTLLHVGCGRQSTETLPRFDFENEWREVRVDIDPSVEPDVIDDIATLSKIPDGSATMVFSKHNIEHLETHAVPQCLANLHRVLEERGFATIRTPDLEGICRRVIKHGPERPLYRADVYGEKHDIMALDMLFGATWEIARGNRFMAHRTAFTKRTLYSKLREAGFEGVEVRTVSTGLELFAIALKKIEGNVYWDVTGRAASLSGAPE